MIPVNRLMTRNVPDFLCIGAQKAGTTWLHAILSAHPDVWLPSRKEIHYFDMRNPPYLPYPDQQALDNESVPNIVGNVSLKEKLARLRKYSLAKLIWEAHYRLLPKNDAWYRRLFIPARGKITGDFTPAYALLNSHAVEKVHRLLPDARIIFIMRNPIERAWSHAKMVLGQHGKRPITNITEQEFLDYLHSEPSQRRGRYLETIDRWLDYYANEAFLPLFFEDIAQDPEQLMSVVLGFLGLNGLSSEMLDVSRTAVHKGQELGMNDAIFARLYDLYEPDMRLMAKRYGGVPQQWLDHASLRIKDVRSSGPIR